MNPEERSAELEWSLEAAVAEDHRCYGLEELEELEDCEEEDESNE